MKRSDLLFVAATVPVDLCMILAAGSAAYFLRFQAFADVRPVIYQLPLQQYVIFLLLVAAYSICIYSISGLYAIRRWKMHNEIQRIIVASSAAIMMLIVVIFFRQEYFSSRFVVLALWILIIMCVIFGRGCIRIVRVACFKNGIGLHSVALLGDALLAQRMNDTIQSDPGLGYSIVLSAMALDDDTRAKLVCIHEEGKLDEILALGDQWSKPDLEALAEFATLLHVDFEYSADKIGLGRLQSTMIAGIPFVEVRCTSLTGWWRILKRIFDICGSLIALGLFSPLIAIIAIAIRHTSKGTIIYKDIRVGRNGVFYTYKFRTMYIEHCTGPEYDATGKAEKLENKLIAERNERKGPVPKVLNDPRRTRIGKWLEATSLDELPQFFNVLIGTMSLVGPRPHRPKEVAGYDTMHHKLFSVKSGITGLAQISGRSDLHFEDEVRLDLYYIEHWSFFMDLAILLKTPYAVLTRKSRV